MARKRPHQSVRLETRKDQLRAEIADLEKQREQVRRDVADATASRLDGVHAIPRLSRTNSPDSYLGACR